MRIDPRVEQPTREMLGHAIQAELPQLKAKISGVGDEVYAAAITLCMIIAGYIAVDLAGRWPTEADVREIARHTAASSKDYELREQDVYDYLSIGALGFRPIDEALRDPEADYTLPVLITAQMLIAFRLGDGHDLWGYLDTVWSAVEAAESADMSILPALLIRQKRNQATANQ